MRKDAIASIGLLACRTERKPLEVLLASGLPKLVLAEGASIHRWGCAIDSNRPYADRDSFIECLKSLVALAAQETLRTQFLKTVVVLRGADGGPITPLSFFCNVVHHLGASRDRFAENLALLGVGAVLGIEHNVTGAVNTGINTGNSTAQEGQDGDTSESQRGADGFSESNYLTIGYSSPDVTGAVTIVQDDDNTSSITKSNNSTLDLTNNIEAEASRFEFDASVLARIVAWFLRESNKDEKVMVRWLALAATANLFSIFSVRSHLLQDQSLLVLPSLARLLIKPQKMQHGGGSCVLCAKLEVVKALCTATMSPSGIKCWLKFENDELLFQDSAGLSQPAPRPEGRPVHVLNDEKSAVAALRYSWHKNHPGRLLQDDSGPHWETPDIKLLLNRLRASEKVWGASFDTDDMIDLCTTAEGDTRENRHTDDVDTVEVDVTGAKHQADGGITLTRSWTLSAWCRGGDWVKRGRATLCQCTNGDKLVCLDDLGRLGVLKGAIGSHPEDMFARWHCVRYPPPGREKFKTLMEQAEDRRLKRKLQKQDARKRGSVVAPRNLLESFLEGHKEDIGKEEGDEGIEGNIGSGDDDDDEDDRGEKSSSEKNYADEFPLLMDDPDRWFHLVVICVPVATQSSDANGDSALQDAASVETRGGNSNSSAKSSAARTRRQYGMDKHKKLPEIQSEMKFFIDGKQIRSTVSTRRPMSKLRVVGNCLDGSEPWGPTADFRFYHRTFSMKGG